MTKFKKCDMCGGIASHKLKSRHGSTTMNNPARRFFKHDQPVIQKINICNFCLSTIKPAEVYDGTFFTEGKCRCSYCGKNEAEWQTKSKVVRL